MPKTTKHCDNCGKEFASYEAGAHFCSTECYRQKRESNIKTVECEHCGKSFDIPLSVLLKGKGRFCSRACCDIDRKTRDRIVKTPGGEIIRVPTARIQCDNCGTEVIRNHSKRGKHSFCCSECFRQYTVRTRRVTKHCKQCGKEFTIKKKLSEQGAGIYCSAKCQADAIRTRESVTCRNCGKEFFAKQVHLRIGHAKYCCHACYLQGCYRDTGGTTIERIVAKLLADMGIDFSPQHRVGRYVCDFFISTSNLVIETDGHYWHSSPKAVAKDARKDAYLLSLGYAVLRLPEDRIESDIQWCEEQIRSHI